MYDPSVPEASIQPFDVALVHSCELILKGNNRVRFGRRLLRNLRDAFESLGAREIQETMGKYIVPLRPGEDPAAVARLLAWIPGVETFAFAHRLTGDFDALSAFIARFAETAPRRTFGIRCRRAWKGYPLDSPAISRELGHIMVERGWTVNLDHPELPVHVDVLRDATLVFFRQHRGPGGLPVGVSGRVVALLSGGIDSPVAARLMAQRGCPVVYTHFHNQTIDSAGVQDKVRRIVAVLQAWQPASRLYLVPFADLQRAIIVAASADLRMILYRRMMVRLANRIADREGALALVTGDSVGQVASQTLENLHAIYAESRRPVLTPLIGLNKAQIVELARQFGTYELSILPYGDCCAFLVGRHPQTRSCLEDVLTAEAAGGFGELETAALEAAEVVSG
jgi:thiamine biosynthesis protein ThiI